MSTKDKLVQGNLGKLNNMDVIEKDIKFISGNIDMKELLMRLIECRIKDKYEILGAVKN